MSKFSKGEGALGLCGPYSFNFFAVPLIGWTMQECRPDTFVHGLLDQAGTTQRHHFQFLARFLAICLTSNIPHYDPAGRGGQPPWSHAGRDRVFPFSFPTPSNPPFPEL